jgi:hypothetical protein
VAILKARGVDSPEVLVAEAGFEYPKPGDSMGIWIAAPQEDSMIADKSRAQNEAAYRALKPTIDRAYPKGRFIAIHDGMIVADAVTLGDLLAILAERGTNPKESLAVQAGIDYPEYVDIL